MAPFTLQAHIFSRDPEAEELTIILQSETFEAKTVQANARMVEYRKTNIGPGEYILTVTVVGGIENKVLHVRRLDITVK